MAQGIPLSALQIKKLMLNHFNGMTLSSNCEVTGIRESTASKIIAVFTAAGYHKSLYFELAWKNDPGAMLRMIYPTAIIPKEGLDETKSIKLGRPQGQKTDYARYLIMIDEQHMTTTAVFAVYLEDCAASGISPISKPSFFRGIRELRMKINDDKEDIAYIARDMVYGEEMQIDWAGQTAYVTINGELRRVWIFVLAWGASGYCVARAVLTQTTEETINALNDILQYCGCKARMLVCDNAKCLISKHILGDVVVNPSFDLYMVRLASELLAAAPRHCQRKQIVEYSVRLIQDRVLPVMEKYSDLDLYNFNVVFQEKVNELINRVGFRSNGTGPSREELFLKYEKPAAQPLPKIMPGYVEVIPGKTVPRSYQIKVYNHFYSVPYNLIGEKVDVVVNADRVEFVQGNHTVASHLRDDSEGRSIIDEHCPPAHQKIRRSTMKFMSETELLDKAAEFSDELLNFCRLRLARRDTQARRVSGRVINLYSRSPNKEIFNEALSMAATLGKLDVQSLLTGFKNLLNEHRENNEFVEVEATTFDEMVDDNDRPKISNDPKVALIRDYNSEEAIRRLAERVKPLSESEDEEEGTKNSPDTDNSEIQGSKGPKTEDK